MSRNNITPRFVDGFEFNQLRPELAESLYYLHHYTKDPKYVKWGQEIFDSFSKWSKAEHGYSKVDGLAAAPGAGGAFQQVPGNVESFWMAETLKYLYLLFAPAEEKIDLDRFVFTTEGHPLKILGGGGLAKQDGGRGVSQKWLRSAERDGAAVNKGEPEPAEPGSL